MPLSEHIEPAIQKVFSAYPGVQAVHVFGSHAAGRVTSDSDLDLAVVPAHGEVAMQKLDMPAALVREGLEEVDLVFLDRVDPIVRFEAVRQNVVVCQRKTFERGTYYSRVIREYFDLEPILRRQREAYKRKLINDP